MTQRLLLSTAVALAGCALATCHPATVTVNKKDETVRLDAGPGRLRTTETGRLVEELRPTLQREYWVQSDHGIWYRVSAAQYRTAEPGRAIEICQ